MHRKAEAEFDGAVGRLLSLLGLVVLAVAAVVVGVGVVLLGLWR